MVKYNIKGQEQFFAYFWEDVDKKWPPITTPRDSLLTYFEREDESLSLEHLDELRHLEVESYSIWTGRWSVI